MNTEIKARWTAALRSGDYPQGRYALRTDKGYCCLGVLGELAVADGIITAIAPEGGRGDWIYDGSSQTLPPAVVMWAGLDSENPSVDLTRDARTRDVVIVIRYSPGGYAPIAAVNDKGVPFGVIADVIDAQL